MTDAKTSTAPVFGAPSGRPPSQQIVGLFGLAVATTAPAPAADMNMTLLGLSCPAAGSCVAVGYYEDQSTALHPLIDTLSGGTWTAADLPVTGLNVYAFNTPFYGSEAGKKLPFPAAGITAAG